jgi:hypothetical protein
MVKRRRPYAWAVSAIGISVLVRLDARRRRCGAAAMRYRCAATAEPDGEVVARAARLGSSTEIDWTPDGVLQCMIEDVSHDHHATFLRSGARSRDSDVFLCWREGSPTQWLADLECCMKTPTRLGSPCTIFRGHPGGCEWAVVDPDQEAVRVRADQLARERGLSEILRTALNGLL